MRYIDDIKTKFITGFTRDITCHFADGDIYRNMSTSATVQDQPTGGTWVRFSTFQGATMYSTIGQGAAKLKETPFFVRISVFVPKNKTFNELAIIETELDSALIGIEMPTNEGGRIYGNTAEPKETDVFYGESGDVWNRVSYTYRYYYRYV